MKILDKAGAEYLVAQMMSRIKLVEYKGNVTTSSSTAGPFTVSNYTPGVDTLGVYVNGLRLIEGVDYSVSGTSVMLTKALDANQACEFVVTKIEF